MISRGIATMTLDTGRCPKWLFERMVKLGRDMTRILVEEYGADEFIKRIADPVWFQALSSVIGMDWNSSGTTTITTGALKEGLRGLERELGIFICGGKGKTSRKTPEEIQTWGERLLLAPSATENLVYNSKMSAKVDSALVQDGYQLYHHSFFFSRNGSWAVVQQGMNTDAGTARRYHWFSNDSSSLRATKGSEAISGQVDGLLRRPAPRGTPRNDGIKDKLNFVCEPHAGIASQARHAGVLNLVAKASDRARDLSVELVEAGYDPLMKDIQLLRKHSSKLSKMVALRLGSGDNVEQLTLLKLEDVEFKSHLVVREDFSKSAYLEKILAKVTSTRPRTYEALVAMEGVGPKTMRALALVGEVIYGAEPSYEDPARYSFAHGGKDSTPYPVDRATYDKTIAILEAAVRRTRWKTKGKDHTLRRLNRTF